MTRGTLATFVALGLAALLAVIVLDLSHSVRKIGLPLSNTGVIREQASQKHLDPALIAAVI